MCSSAGAIVAGGIHQDHALINRANFPQFGTSTGNGLSPPSAYAEAAQSTERWRARRREPCPTYATPRFDRNFKPFGALGAPRSPALEAVGLKRCDARIEAHTDALLLAEEHAWPLVARALTSDEPAAAAAAAMVIASAADAERERRLVEVFSTAGAETRAALRAVLELRAGPGLRAALRALTELAAPVEASVWMVAAAHGEKTVPPRRAH